MSLYAITNEISDIIDALLEGGQTESDANVALEEHLAGLDAALEDKADEMRLDIARVGNALTIMRVLSTVERKPAPAPVVDDLSMPF